MSDVIYIYIYGWTYVRQEFLKWTIQTQNYFLRKIVCLTIYHKIKYTEEIFSLTKIHCFLKVLRTLYNEIPKIITTIVMKERLK